MIPFTILFIIFASIALTMAIVAIVVLATVIGAAILIFGDVIIFVLIVWAIIELILNL